MFVRFLLSAVVLTCIGTSAFAEQTSWFAEEDSVEIDPSLIETLQTRGTANALIMLSERADLSPAYAMSWLERGRFVHQALTAVAERSQAPIRHELSRQRIAHQAFWIDNLIAVESLHLDGLQSLVQFREIERIILEPESFLIEPEQIDLTPMPPRAARAPEPNLVQIGAPEVWALGITGAGLIVANIDSGVRHSHQALVGQYRGNLGGGSFKAQFKRADRSQARYALVLGEAELAAACCQIKDLRGDLAQESVSIERLAARLEELLGAQTRA